MRHKLFVGKPNDDDGFDDVREIATNLAHGFRRRGYEILTDEQAGRESDAPVVPEHTGNQGHINLSRQRAGRAAGDDDAVAKLGDGACLMCGEQIVEAVKTRDGVELCSKKCRNKFNRDKKKAQ